jgi:hypothetical protein
MTLAGFPHSGITGSQPACGSPMLFAAYHALHRLSVPRHPPCALVRLTGSSSILHFKPASSHVVVLDHTHCPKTQVVNQSSEPLGLLRTARRFHPRGRDVQIQERAQERRSTCENFRLPKELTRVSRKEVIQPQVPLRLPCYDFAPVIELAFGRSLPAYAGLGNGLRALPTSMA